VANFLGSVNLFRAEVVGETADGVLLDVPDLGARVLTTEGRGLAAGQAVTLALRPEKLVIHRSRPASGNVVEGEVKDLAYFGKDSLYRVNLPGGVIVNVHAVNRARTGEGRPDWYDRVWLAFEPSAAIVLTD
jgi:putrescine transport system ATP-binding protein